MPFAPFSANNSLIFWPCVFTLIRPSTVGLISFLRSDPFLLFYFSSTDMTRGEQFSEFWNHDDEGGTSEEDISDSDGESFLRTFLCISFENFSMFHGWGC